ncbi:hypothetical protein Vi05172_g10519 [Venturia inaequalis]|nr:hypothetical protein Vi05172_g10519 [Venturia inaequalis]
MFLPPYQQEVSQENAIDRQLIADDALAIGPRVDRLSSTTRPKPASTAPSNNIGFTTLESHEAVFGKSANTLDSQNSIANNKIQRPP